MKASKQKNLPEKLKKMEKENKILNEISMPVRNIFLEKYLKIKEKNDQIR